VNSGSHLLVLNGEQVRQALPMEVCIEAVEQAMRAVSRGEAKVPLRTGMSIPGGNLFAVMPGYLGEPSSLGAKILALYPGNTQRGLSSHVGLVTLFDPRTGMPLAVMDAAQITAIRTAAASAVATRSLARQDVTLMAMLGTGEQAVTHLEALAQVRSLRAVRIWGRSPEKAQALAVRERSRFPFPIEVCGSARAAVEGADLVCTLTASTEPILEGRWLALGAHVNLVGASQRGTREADDEVVIRSRFFVDLRISAIAEAGELYHAMQAGLVKEDHILGEIGEVLGGKVPGRTADTDITVYKSLGIAAQDLAAAHVLYARASSAGIGTWVPF
jgi:ornithine cyclodeaminase